MKSNLFLMIFLGLGFLALGTSITVAQTPFYRLFTDEPTTPSLCDVVNLARASAGVIDATGELQVLDGAVIPFSQVDVNGFVSVDRVPVGFIAFADDGDGLRTLWWLWFDGSVVDLDRQSEQPRGTLQLPSDFQRVACGACDIIDDLEICGCGDAPGCCNENADCDDDNECTTDVCESFECVHEIRDAVCDDFDACTEDDLCVNGVCAGVAIEGCETQPGDPNVDDPTANDPVLGGGGAIPRLTFSLCGTGATLALWMTAVGLVTARTTRRRHPRAAGFSLRGAPSRGL